MPTEKGDENLMDEVEESEDNRVAAEEASEEESEDEAVAEDAREERIPG
jgi:hypothetical protein